MPRPDMRAERIPQIIEAAMRVFARNGFAQTRMEDIAQQAGLSKATLYLYFASKDEVIAAILQTYFEHGVGELTALRAGEEPVLDSLLSWTRQRLQELQNNAALLSIGLEFHALAARQMATREILRHYYAQYRGALSALLAQGMQRGEVRLGDADELAVALIGLYEGLTLLWMVDPAGLDLAAIAERAVHTLFTSPAQL